MKNYLHSLFVALVATTTSLSAQTIVIDDGFEQGIQETEWTQEFVSGNMPWAVESEEDGLAYPATAFQGTHRAYLRNTTGETQGYVTRLVSKVMDLSPRVIYQPELTFWYANPRWGADCDTLRVLYRTKETAKWKFLAEYSSGSKDWQKVILSLPECTATYQIAFEGTDNIGRGIVLDSVKLRSAPDCTIPNRIVAASRGLDRVNISWFGSYDAEFYELIVSRDTIDPNEVNAVDPSLVVYHEMINGRKKNIDLTLVSGEYYFVYVRSICEREISAWSNEINPDARPYKFRVRATKNIPYFCDFNYAKPQTQDTEWTWGNSTGKVSPYVYSTTGVSELELYSPTKTPAVVFSGGTASATNTTAPTTPIPVSKYVYLATPTLTDTMNANFSISQCQVHFWSTVSTSTGHLFAHSLIVGVMDDPDDIATFVPVDTVSVWGSKTFTENIVDLSSYTGTGAYVAFVSDFSRQNVFYIDDVTIEYSPQVRKVTEISVNPRDTYADITWQGNASSYNVLITSAEVDPSNPTASAVVDRATVSTNSYHCTALEQNHSWNRPYYVYVQAVGADWSYRYPFVTVASMRELPYKFDFETASGKYKISQEHPTGMGIFTNGTKYPYLASTNSYMGSQCLYLDNNIGKDTWITLPMVEKLDSAQVKFYLSGSNQYAQSHVIVGVMTNPMDINTFTPVEDFFLTTTGYTMCYVNFKNYHGPNGVIAIVWGDVAGMTQKTINYIDELRVEKLADCVPPENAKLELESDSVTLRWDLGSEDSWEIVVSTSALTPQQKEKTLAELSGYGTIVYADTLKWKSITQPPFFGLGGLTSQKQYYMYVRALCFGDVTWWKEYAFVTPCPGDNLPFFEGFESYNSGATAIGCWQLKNYKGGKDFPKITSSVTASVSSKHLQLLSDVYNQSIAAMPMIEGDFKDMFLSFDVKPADNSKQCELLVGTTNNIADAGSFVPFETISLPVGAGSRTVRLMLSDYNLKYHTIAFSSGSGISNVLIDNVQLIDASCTEAYNLRVTDSQTTSVSLSWKGRSVDNQWKVKVLKENLPPSMVAAGTYDPIFAVVNDSIVTGNAVYVTGLSPVHTYYIYMQPVCGDKPWSAITAQTACVPFNPNVLNKETFESYPAGTQANCWTAHSASVSTISGNNVYEINTDGYVATQEIACSSMSELAVTFTGSSRYNSYWLFLGVMSDPNDPRTFVKLESIECSDEPAIYRIDLAEYAELIPSDARYFAWFAKNGTILIDDVTILKMTCPLTHMSYSNLTDHSVRINSGLHVNNEWVLLVSGEPLDIDSLNSGYHSLPENIIYNDTLSSSFLVVRGLQEKTRYYAYTATLCEGATFLWSGVSFTTPCAPILPQTLGTVTFSENEGFVTGANGYLPCWTVGSKTPDVNSNGIPYIDTYSGNQHKGHNSLRFCDEVGNSTNHVGAYAIMPEMNVDQINKYQVIFWGRGASVYNSQIIVGVATDPSGWGTFVPLDTINLSQSWDLYTVPLDSYEGDYVGDQGRYIMFLSDFGKTNYAYITEISVQLIPSCPMPTSFSVDSVGENEAIVSWSGSQNSYRLLVADRELEDAEKPSYHYFKDTIVDHSDRVLIHGLNPATSYYVYAQAICSVHDRSAVSMLGAAFRTECPVETGLVLPFHDDFESYEVNQENPGCWIFTNVAKDSPFPNIEVYRGDPNNTRVLHVRSYNSNSGSGIHSIAVAPAVNGRLQDLLLSFDARPWNGSGSASSGKKLFIGTMADPTDPTTFVPATTCVIPSSNSFKHYEIALGDFDLPYDYLAFTSGMEGMIYPLDNDFYLDNVKLRMLSACHAPDLKASEISYRYAKLDIIPANDEYSTWEIVAVADSIYNQFVDISTYLDTVSSVVTTDNVQATVSGLEPATIYHIYARTACGGKEGYSEWSRKPLVIRTPYYYKDEYFFGFEKNEPWERSTNSSSDDYYIHPALVTGYGSLGAEVTGYNYYPYGCENMESYLLAHTGTGALAMNAAGNYYGGYVILPPINEPKDRSFEFKARPAALRTNTMKPVASHDATIEIGTIDRYKGFETYQLLATVDISKLNSDTEVTDANNYLFNFYTLDLDAATMETKQLVLHMPKQPEKVASIYIDDVTLGEPKGFSLVSFSTVSAGSNQALIEWKNLGGPWNLYVISQSGDTIADYYDLHTTSQVVENLDPQTEYIVVLEAAEVPDGIAYTTSASRRFSTICEAQEPSANTGDFYWNFDDASGWEANDVLEDIESDSLYFKPECFTVGVPYAVPVNGYQWLVQRKGYNYQAEATSGSKYADYEVGVNNSNALRIFTDKEHLGSYLVLPELNCDLSTMMIEFYGRCFANYNESAAASNRGQVVDASYLGASYSRSLVVGTLDYPNDFSTLEVIDTLTYSKTHLNAPTNVNDDPNGMRYWEKMQLPLMGAKGRYIVLFQPSEGLFFLDELSIKPIDNTLFAPTSLRVDAITATSAELKWNVHHPALSSVVVILDATGSTEIIRDTVAGNTYSASGLNGGTSYQCYVYQTDGMHNSQSSATVHFATECISITPAYTCGFEIEDGWSFVPDQDIQSSIQSLCWTYGDAAKDAWTRSYDAENISNNEKYAYAHSGSYAVFLNGTRSSSTIYQPYIAMPAMDIAAYDTLQVSFWMRPAEVNASTGQVTEAYTGGSYSKSIIVGTMTDPNNAATFMPIDTITYDGLLAMNAMATEANDYLYQYGRVSLAGATGPYVAFMTSFREKGSTTNKNRDCIFMDDISFSRRQDCETPVGLSYVQIGAEFATLSWKDDESDAAYILQVSPDIYFSDPADMIFNDTVRANSYTVTGLQGTTQYAWRVKRICESKISESLFSKKESFTTARAPYYLETFDTLPLDGYWMCGSAQEKDVLDKAVAIEQKSNQWNFYRDTSVIAMSTPHYVVRGYADNYNWLVSPVFYIPENDSVHLSLDLALTSCNTSDNHDVTTTAATSRDIRNDYSFHIIVSTDAGKTWKKENIIAKWDSMQLLDIPAVATNFRYSLARYAGKSICIGFYRQAETKAPTGIAIHLDNFRLGYFDKIEENYPVCRYEDFTWHGTTISGNDMQPGVNTYSALRFASDAESQAGVHDTVNELNLDVISIPETVFEETICEGSTYTDENFQGKSTGMKYQRKLLSVHGCDSTIILQLHVTPRSYAEEEQANICPGDKFTWKGKQYDRAGIYRDTTVSAAGCDSIETLVLMYHTTDEDTIYAATTITKDDLPFTYTNAEHPYAIGQAPIFYPAGTPMGEYKDTVMVQGVACSAALVHTLTIKAHDGIEEISTDRNGARKVIYRDNMYIILNDEWYNISGQRVSDPRK